MKMEEMMLFCWTTLATTSNPLVPLSNLCTIPGRTDVSLVPNVWFKGDSSNSISDNSSESETNSWSWNEGVGRLQWWRMPFTSVPVVFPGAGWTTWSWNLKIYDSGINDSEEEIYPWMNWKEVEEGWCDYHVCRFINNQHMFIFIHNI